MARRAYDGCRPGAGDSNSIDGIIELYKRDVDVTMIDEAPRMKRDAVR
jgi:hypothetical protein